MPLYENVFLARQDVSHAQVEALAANFAEVLGAGGGSVKKTEMWGLKSLTYRINKNRKAHYVLMNIEAPSAAVIEMERNMRLNEDVLRYLTIKVEALEEGPSAVVVAKSERGDRAERGDRGDRGGFGGFGGGGRERSDRRPRRDSETGGEG